MTTAPLINVARAPKTNDELYELVQLLWGVTIPRTPVCPNHSTPFDAFADAYFARSTVSVWKACVPGDTPVMTVTGPVAAQDVRPGMDVISFDGEPVTAKVTDQWSSGVQHTLRIRTRAGELACTPNHVVLVQREVGWRRYEPRWVRADEILPGDMLVRPHDYAPEGEDEDLDWCELAGLILADGNVQHYKFLIAHHRDAEYMGHYEAICERLFGKPMRRDPQNRCSWMHSLNAAEQCRERGLSGTAHTKRVPAWVWQASREGRIAFLRGFLDGDGTVRRDGVEWFSCSRWLLEDIRQLCMSVGVRVGRVRRTPMAGSVEVNGRMVQRNDMYAVRAYDLAIIGSNDPKYTFATPKPQGYVCRGQRWVGHRVLSVDPGDEVETFDIEVAGTESFVADGYVVHNSRGFGGKSRTLAYLVLTEAATLGAEVNLLGGSGAQSQNIHEAMSDGWSSPVGSAIYQSEVINDTQIYTTLRNGARVKALMASQRSVRGPHPQRLRMDEIDEMEIDILESAFGQPMAKDGVEDHIVLSSTHQYPDKCVAAGTLVLTRRGEIPVENVKTGDQVMTRKGWRRVKSQMMSGYRRVVQLTLSNGRVLTCTDDHRIAVPDPVGWTIPKWMSLGEEVVGINPSLIFSEPGAGVRPLPEPLSAATCLDSRPDSVTGLTFTRSSGVDSGVGLREFVTLGAVSLPGVEGRCANSSEKVLVLGDGLQVSDVDTSAVTAQMIDLFTLPEGTNETNECPAVGTTSEVLTADPAVPLAPGTAPYPASTGVDAAPVTEPVFVVDSHTVRVLQPVYDLEVEDQHEFVAEGVVVHNTMSEMLRRAGEMGWEVHEWCWKECSNPVDGWLTQTMIDRKRQQVPKHMWEVEYDLQEPSFGSRAFETECVEKAFSGWCVHEKEYYYHGPCPVDDNCEHPGRQTYKTARVIDGEQYEFEAPDLRKGEYVTAADWAKERDYTVITTFRVDCDPWRVVAYSRTNRKPYPMMVDLFNKRLKRYGGSSIHDGTGLGNVINDYIDDRTVSFIMTGRQRDDMLSEHVNGVEKLGIVSPKIESAYTAHKYCSIEDLYGRGKDTHLPDEVCSYALAWHLNKRRAVAAVPALDLATDGSYWSGV